MEKLTKAQLIEEVKRLQQENKEYMDQAPTITAQFEEVMAEKGQLAKEVFSLKSDIANATPVIEAQAKAVGEIAILEETVIALVKAIRFMGKGV